MNDVTSEQDQLLGVAMAGAAEAEEDVVVGASKREQSLGSVASAVTIVTQERLRRFGYRTLAEALESVAPLARNGEGSDRPVPYPRHADEPGYAAETEDGLGSRLRRAEQGVVRWAGESEESFNARLDTARCAVLGLAREAEETTEAFGFRLREAVAAAKRKIVETAHDLRDEAASATDRAGGTVHRVGDTLAQGSAAARGAVGDVLAGIGNNPVLLGALGFAGGAILGTLVPLSEAEEKALGGVELHGSLASLKEVIERNWSVEQAPEMFCFGLLEAFDTPQLTALVAPRPVQVD